MALAQIPSLPTRGPPPPIPVDPRVIVRLRGDQDISTVPALSVELAQAIAINDADLVLDLRDVPFMDASTVGVIIGAREFLRPRGRSLTLRSISGIVRRLIEVCDLDDLVERRPSSHPAESYER